ncbi:MerR family transcriptional regulator [Methylobacillus sp.]|uniref:MerR family transcriptional regulator n=1 Tax=Methylobacillus sp. TaxID=56818 RepID=UPI002FE039B5
MSAGVYTINDIADAAGVSSGRVKTWIRWRLLPPALSSSPDGRNYTTDHMHRAVRLQAWFEARVTVCDLAERLAVMGDRALDVCAPYGNGDLAGTHERE